MSKPTWIRSKDGKHLAGSIGVGKADVPTTRREIKNQAKQVKEQDRQNRIQAKIQAKHENMLIEQRVTSLRIYGVLSPYWPGTTQYYKNKKDLAQIAKIEEIKENCLTYNEEDENSPEYKKLLSKIKDADRYDYVTGIIGYDVDSTHEQVKKILNQTILSYAKGHGGVFRIDGSPLAEIISDITVCTDATKDLEGILRKITESKENNFNNFIAELKKYKMFSELGDTLESAKNASSLFDIALIYTKAYNVEILRKRLGATSNEARGKVRQAFYNSLNPFVKGWPSDDKNYFLAVTDELINNIYP